MIINDRNQIIFHMRDPEEQWRGFFNANRWSDPDTDCQ